MKSNMSLSRFILSVLLLTILLFVGANLLFLWVDPLDELGGISAYNQFFPGRLRLPYGERPDLAYNLSLYNIPAMFAPHELSAPKVDDEYRVVLIGDSATWGFLLKPEETLAAQLNATGLQAPDGRIVHFYNVGYPTISLTKDLLMLKKALEYQPDLVIWRTTLEAFPLEKQLSSPIAANNPERVNELIEKYDLRLDDTEIIEQTTLDRSLIGARRPLADLIRLQVYGVLWAATGVDQFYPDKYDPPISDLDPDPDFHDIQPPTLPQDALAWDVLTAGVEMSVPPVLVINEPIYISEGENADIHYNFFYPRWAYDQYRQQLASWCIDNHVTCLDAWDMIPADEFSNSAIHISAAGERLLAERVKSVLEEQFFER